MMNRNFLSDNASGVAPEILAAVERANSGSSPSYGADAITERLQDLFGEVFGKQVWCFPVVSGTAANALALSAMTPPWGAIYCHAHAHIAVDECGAPEFYTGGAKLVPLPGSDGKLDPLHFRDTLAARPAGNQHEVQPAAVSITQASECGTVYLPEEVQALSGIAEKYDMHVHMDGARFANAVAHLACRPADISWRAGVDVLSFGATKNGAMAAEAVLFFDGYLAENFLYRRKRAGHLLSKMRFLSAQLEAYLTRGLWLKLASHANMQAQRLAAGLAELPGCKLIYQVEGNEIFLRLPGAMIEGLARQGFLFHRWHAAGADAIRLVTAFDTRDEDVDDLIRAATHFAEDA